MSCPRYSVKFDNLLREFSQLRGFQQTLRTVLEMVSQNRKDFKEVLQAAAWPFFVGDWRNTDEKPWLPSAHQMPPPKCPESFRAIALAQAGFFFLGRSNMGAAQERPVWQAVKTYWSLLLGNALEWYEFCLYSFLEPYFEAGVSWVEPGSAQVRSQVLEQVFNQPIDWYNCLIWTWVQLKLGNPKSNMRYITVTSENN